MTNTNEHRLLTEWQAGERNRRHGEPEHEASAQDAPVRRPAFAGLELHEQGAAGRDHRYREADQEHGLVGQDLREPAARAGDQEGPGGERQPSQDLHHAEVVIDVGFRARASILLGARHDLRAHGVGDDILQHDADDDEKLRCDIKMLGGRERDPLSGGTREQDEAAGNEARADVDVGAPLRAEYRHAVDELAEHHFHRPRQRQPDTELGQRRRRERQRLLDPEAVGDGDQAQRAISEVHHEERPIDRPHGTHRRQQRALGGPPQVLDRRCRCRGGCDVHARS